MLTVDDEYVSHLYLGSRAIDVRSFPGHTGGDSIVVVPDAKVAFLGDLFWRNMLPNSHRRIDEAVGRDDGCDCGHERAGLYVRARTWNIGDVKDVAAFRN